MTGMDERRARQQRLHPPGRLEAFGDGVFAIAITLLVLEIAVPVLRGGSLLHGLARQWPSFLAYLISFFTIGVVWIAHYGITRSLRGVDEIFLRLNLLFLFFVAFLPYPTKLVAEFLTEPEQERVAVTVYSLTLLVISVTRGCCGFTPPRTAACSPATCPASRRPAGTPPSPRYLPSTWQRPAVPFTGCCTAGTHGRTADVRTCPAMAASRACVHARPGTGDRGSKDGVPNRTRCADSPDGSGLRPLQAAVAVAEAADRFYG